VHSHQYTILTVIARLVLNYKKIDYKTEWVEYPDLAPKLKALCVIPSSSLSDQAQYTDIISYSGIPPNDPKSPGYHTDYSSPTMRYADGTYMQDSWPIAHKLEEIYPSPSLHLDDPIVVQVRDQIDEIMSPIRGFFIPKVPVVLLNKSSADYFFETRKKRFGMELAEVERTLATDEQWEKARAPAEKTGQWLRKNGGPFFLGGTGE
jgi:hypothetical protein